MPVYVHGSKGCFLPVLELQPLALRLVHAKEPNDWGFVLFE